jgi:hypothetical protein
MTILPMECPHCGATLRIETDDPKYLEKRKEQFLREHERC